MTAFMYDGAYSPNLATCKKHGGIAASHYLTGSYASTSAQPRAIRAAGMGAVPNWERMPGALVNATREEGQAIGREAMAAVDKGCPRDGSVGIYFSVDLEVSGAHIASCDAAFQGINDVLRGKFKVKVYGEGALINHLVSKGLVQGKQWLSMSTAFPGFNAASPNVCMVQMHDAHGAGIGTDVKGTDRNTVTDPHAVDAWWPSGSPYAVTNGDDMSTGALSKEAATEIQAIMAGQFSRFFASKITKGVPHDDLSLSAWLNLKLAPIAKIVGTLPAAVAANRAETAVLSKEVDALTAKVAAMQAGRIEVGATSIPATLNIGVTK